MKAVKRLPAIVQIVFVLVLIASLAACASQPSFKYETDKSLVSLLAKAPDYPETSFVVFSDPHIFDTSLGTTGKAFEAYIAADRKLVREGPEIIESAVAAIKDLKANIVLVSGDLTKDGEKSSHDVAAGYLAQLKAAGKKVYVVPGNHDIKNGLSYGMWAIGCSAFPISPPSSSPRFTLITATRMPCSATPTQSAM